MTVKKRKVEAPSKTTETEQKAVKIGFTCAVLDDGELVFNVHGNPGIIELQGLVAFAVKVADAKFKDQLSIDDVAILKELRVLASKIDALEVEQDELEV